MGFKLRAQALPFLATQPNYGHVGSLYGAAGAGTAQLARFSNDMYRQEAGDTVKALKLHGDASDERARAGKSGAYVTDALKKLKEQWGRTPAGPDTGPDNWDSKFGGTTYSAPPVDYAYDGGNAGDELTNAWE